MNLGTFLPLRVRVVTLTTVLLLALGVWVPGAAHAQQQATGVVFHDENGNGERDSGEKGIAGVAVSNGTTVVETDSGGGYQLPVDDDAIIFVIKPRNWLTGLDPENNLPRFYYVHKPEGSPESRFPGVEPTGPLPESIDFPLTRHEEPDTFEVIFFGDPQPRNVEEVDYLAHDIVEELIGKNAAFGVTLGDIVFDDLAVFDPLNAVIGTVGVPWYNVLGNHDVNMDTDDDTLSDETFERIYGPNYYSFDYGPVHFVVLDNVFWEGDGYHGELGEDQLSFIENDLALVPNDKLIVFMMHIPLVDVEDKEALFEIIKGRPNTLSISAHWHRQRHYSLGRDEGWLGDGEHHHIVHGTTSGSWWSGEPDEFGIPHTMMSDGTPNGYSIATFRGTHYLLRYKVARRPADFQMSLHAPDFVAANAAAGAQVVANVFMGSDDTDVTMRIGDDGEWKTMTKEARPDPYYQALKDREYILPRAAGRFLPSVQDSTHIWTAPLPADLPEGAHVIHVRAVDTFGETHTGKRIIRVQ